MNESAQSIIARMRAAVKARRDSYEAGKASGAELIMLAPLSLNDVERWADELEAAIASEP